MNRTMRELECLNVVNLCDGKILGTICDMEIEPNCGKITAIYITSGKGILFGNGENIKICWEQIKCIGEDTVLIEYKREICCDKNNTQRRLFGWFSKI